MNGSVRIDYGPHPSQFLELFQPAAAAAPPWPVAVVIHGGFWRSAYGMELARPLAADLAAAGVAAVALEYRRVGPDPRQGGGGWPHTLLDVAAGTDLLAGGLPGAVPLALDVARVVAVGHSAGGQLAGWLAARASLPPGAVGADPQVRLRGLVSQAGVLDLRWAHRAGLGAGAVADFIGGSPADRAEAYASASPIERLPLGLPSVCVHGSADAEVPIEVSERFVAAARAAGDSSRLVRLDGVDHYALIEPGHPAWRRCRTAVLELLGHAPGAQ